MREITAYDCRDGRRFYDKARAIMHEQELDEVAALPIAPKHDFTDREVDGDGYVQHPVGTKDRLFAALRASRYTHPRQADDSDSPFWTLGWARWMAMDDQDREWAQAYFANNPNPAAREIRT
jgi:hypothetical protein